MFSDNTLACLRAAGWSEDYHADITPYQQSAEAEGCPLPAIVTAFLTKFGRLKITYPRDPRIADPGSYSLFFLEGEYTTEFCEELEFMAEKIGVHPVYKVGWLRGEGDLLMDLEGKVYLFFGSSAGGSVQFLASSGEDVIEMLCSDTYGTPIKSW